METVNNRELPIAQVKQVIERPIIRSNGIKSGDSKESRKDALKSGRVSVKAMDMSTAFKTLSGLKRAVVKAHQACQMAEMDIEDMKYADPTAVLSAPQDSPQVVKSLEAIRDASKLIQKASDLVESAKQAMAVPAEADPSQAMLPNNLNVKKR